MELSLNSNLPGPGSENVNLEQHSFTPDSGRDKLTQKVVFEREFSLPERNCSYETYRRKILADVLKKTVEDAMLETSAILAKCPDFAADFMTRLTFNELISNAIFYGFLDLTSEEKGTFISRGTLGETEEDQILRQKIMESDTESHRGLLRVEVSKREIKITIQDSGGFPGFDDKWREVKARTDIDGDNPNGRALMILAGYYDEATQDKRSGAITFSKRFRAAEAA